MISRRLSSWTLAAAAVFLGSCGGGGSSASGTVDGAGASSGAAVAAVEVGDNPDLPGYTGLPDIKAVTGKSNSGRFLDMISDPGRTQSIRQAAHYVIVVPASATELKVQVFDGNCGGLWDQNQITYGAGDTLQPDGSAVEYRLSTDGPGETVANPQAFVKLGESPRAAQTAGAVVLSQDDAWEPLFIGALPSADRAKLSDGSHRYALDVKYVVDANDSINGFKIAANGKILIAPKTGDATIIGGFIGGVVDSREMHFPNDPSGKPIATTYAVSRDFYPSGDGLLGHQPNFLTPTQAFSDTCTDDTNFKPAVLHPQSASNTFKNSYDGTIDIPIDLIPDASKNQTWLDYVQKLVLEEGDADDVVDALPGSPAGTQNPGIPADDGQPYPLGAPTRDNSGYRLPQAAAPSLSGSPWLELIDPNGVAQTPQHDLSGNVTQAPTDPAGSGDAQGWEKIVVPTTYVFNPLKTTWTIRIHNLDARNTWFIRSNVKPPQDTGILGEIGDRVWIDKLNDCNGVQDPVGAGANDERGVNGVKMNLYKGSIAPANFVASTTTRNLIAPEAFQTPASGPFGIAGYYLFDNLAVPGGTSVTYVVEVDASNFLAGGPLFGYTRTAPSVLPATATLTSIVPIKNSDRSLDFGFCKKTGRIGDRVWVDKLNDCNGVQDAVGAGANAERGVNGVKMNLLRDGQPAGSTLTRDLVPPEAFADPASGPFGTAGYYSFENLDLPSAGTVNFTVEVDPSNFLVGGPLFGFARTYPKVLPATTTLSTVDPVKLSDRSLDFGFCKKTGRIGDRVWIDKLNDCNGVQDPIGTGPTAERGVNGVKVNLLKNGIFAATTTTRDLVAPEAFAEPATGPFGTAGYYSFEDLEIPAVGGVLFTVEIDPSNFLAGGPLEGYTRTYPSMLPASTTLQGVDPVKLSDRSLDFGFCKRTGRIGDRVWVDKLNDCNGEQDPVGAGANAERGVNGVKVNLFRDGVPAGSMLTRDLVAPEAFQNPASGPFGTAGYYAFEDLALPADGSVVFTVAVDASNFLPGGPLFGYARTYPKVLPASTKLSTADPVRLTDLSLDFGFCRKTGRIGDRVWVDKLNDCNGAQDPAGVGANAEHGVNGVKVNLLKNGVFAATTTTRDLVAPEAFAAPVSGGFGTAGYYSFEDLELPAEGTVLFTVEVDLSNFLVGGPLAGYARTYPAALPASTTLSTVEPFKLSDRSLDFGFCRKTGRIGDRIWVDGLNECDGIQGPVGGSVVAEHGVNGVKVNLLKNGVFAATTTSRDLVAPETFADPATGPFGTAGYYSFDDLELPAEGAVTYTVEVDPSNFLPGGPLAGYTRTYPAVLPASTTLTTAVPVKLSDRSLDFGFCKRTGRIGDRIWVDAVNECDGVQNPVALGANAERGVNGVKVNLFRDGQPAGSTTTRDLVPPEAFADPATGPFGTAGYYSFDDLVLPVVGNVVFTVEVDPSNFLPGGALFGYARTYPAVLPASTTLTPAKRSDRSLDFGFCRKTGRIGDRVWVDKLNECDGVQNPVGVGANAERGVNGVKVNLLKNGVFASTTTTRDLVAPEAFADPATGPFGTAGYYSFENLELPAEGTVNFTVEIDPSNFLPGGPLFGYARTFPAALPAATTLSTAAPVKLSDRSLDFGFCRKTVSLGDRVWIDQLNGCNGRQDPVIDPANPNGERGVNDVAVTLFVNAGGVLTPVVAPAGVTWTNPQFTHDLPAGVDFRAPAPSTPGGFGNAGYYEFDGLPEPEAGITYVVQVNDSNFLLGGALFGFTQIVPAVGNTQTATFGPARPFDFTLDFAYCHPKKGRIGDRVWVDKLEHCDGVQDPVVGNDSGDERGVNGVIVNLFRNGVFVRATTTRDLLATEAFQDVAGPFGSAGYYVFEDLDLPADGTVTYTTEVDAGNFLVGGPLFGYSRTFPAASGTQTATLSTSNTEDYALDFGFCKKCQCESGKVHELCLEAKVWLSDPSPCNLDVYVKLDRGCPTCEPKGKRTDATMADLATFTMGREFPGEQVGRNRLIRVKDVRVVDGYARVLVCLEANCPYFPESYFDGKINVEVTVNGVGEAVCSTVDCHCLTAGGVFPKDWKPLWCDDIPAFFVWSFTPWECVDHPECKPPCPPPPCPPPPCEKPPVCEQPPTCEKPPVCEKPPTCEKPPVCVKPPSCEKPPKCDKPPSCEKPPTCDKPEVVCEKPPKCDKPPSCDKPPKCEKPEVVCEKPPKCDKPEKACDKPPKREKPEEACAPKPKGKPKHEVQF